MSRIGHDSLKTRRALAAGGREYDYFSLPAAAAAGIGPIERLPFSLKVLLENLLRHEDGASVRAADIEALAARRAGHEIAFRPARVLMQDFTGVPAAVDLAAMRDAMAALGKDPARIDPLVPVDLAIDHSVQVDKFASPGAFAENVRIEMERNRERYAFLRWGQQAFRNFRVVPPGAGICHQVNLEYLARTVWTSDADDGRAIAYPDTLVGTDSHTTMVNGLAVLGWGAGGIEAEAAMLGQPISMPMPQVVGVRLTGAPAEGATATDLVLAATQMLRAHGVVGKFVEFAGPGLDGLPLADRATLANMAPEYGATCGFFPIDAETLRYLRFTGRAEEQCALVEAYARAQGLWREPGAPEPEFDETLTLDLGTVEPSIAGPRRPQDRVPLRAARNDFERLLAEEYGRGGGARSAAIAGAEHRLEDGAVVIAAITSCTNTSNPAAMIGAGLLARKARAKGLATKPWVKTSLAPGAKAVTEYLAKSGLDRDLNALGFHLVGYGCTTCIGNSGPLPEPIDTAIVEGGLAVAAVLSGNRNFEGRIHPRVRANYLASPPLVVAYALAGTMRADLARDPLGTGAGGAAVFLRDIWPSAREIADAVREAVAPEMFGKAYGDVFTGDAAWRAMPAPAGPAYNWPDSTYVRKPPYFAGFSAQPPAAGAIENARVLVMLGDSVTTDHISPAGGIAPGGPAADYLAARGAAPADFNSYGARRGNHEVMMRGTFANIRLRNELAPGTEGGWTRIDGAGEPVTVYEAAQAYAKRGAPLVVVAGKEYGAGSSRDWAAKGPKLLGVRAVIVESFERIHRANLVGMGVLPLQFTGGMTRRDLRLDGTETLSFSGFENGAAPGMTVECRISRAGGGGETFDLLCRIDTADEAAYFANGGILHYVLRKLAA